MCICIYIYIYTYVLTNLSILKRSVAVCRWCTPPEKDHILGKISFRSTDSGAGEQSLLLSFRARARVMRVLLPRLTAVVWLHEPCVMAALLVHLSCWLCCGGGGGVCCCACSLLLLLLLCNYADSPSIALPSACATNITSFLPTFALHSGSRNCSPLLMLCSESSSLHMSSSSKERRRLY